MFETVALTNIPTTYKFLKFLNKVNSGCYPFHVIIHIVDVLEYIFRCSF